jgi:co-chaperonin GroES (HSP10)
MSNVSGINPVGWRILVKPQEIKEMSESGIVITSGKYKER